MTLKPSNLSAFNGLLIILNRPSRFDLKAGPNKLFTGYAGDWFKKQLFKNGIVYENCIISTADDKNYVLESVQYKACLLLGEESFRLMEPNPNNTLNEYRGYPLTTPGNYPIIASYAPQDCFDVVNYEAMFNKSENSAEYEDESKVEDDEFTTKAHGNTRRKNYRFWLSKDIAKIGRVLRHGLAKYPPLLISQDNPSSAIKILHETKNANLYFDIETDPDTCDITCFSFSFSPHWNTVFLVPVRTYQYQTYYDITTTCKIFAALAVAFRDNTVVSHNGAMFDMFLMAWKYKIPFGRHIYDTMIAHSRCFPEVEKSLGHCLSLYTDLPYHKNTVPVYVPKNSEQQQALWKYNALDVYSMAILHKEIAAYAERIGAIESINQANASIAPYLTLTFRGIATDGAQIIDRLLVNNRLVNQYLRILKILAGKDLNPRSPKQMKEYLYKAPPQGLGLKPPAYSKTTNEPKCDEKALMKLLMKNPLPSANVILKIRGVQKESEAMEFEEFNYAK